MREFSFQRCRFLKTIGDTMSTERVEVGAFLDRLQVAVGTIAFEPTKGLSCLERLVKELPDTLCGARSVVIAARLCEVIVRAAESAGASVKAVVNGEAMVAVSLAPRSGEWKQHTQNAIQALLVGSPHFSAARSRPVPFEVDQLLRIIDEQYARSTLTLAEVSRMLGRSLGHLSRLTRDYMGCGFRDRLRRRRVEAADDMLRYSSLTLKEVGVAAGFSNASQFSRQYKAVRGFPPSALRQKGYGDRHQERARDRK